MRQEEYTCLGQLCAHVKGVHVFQHPNSRAVYKVEHGWVRTKLSNRDSVAGI